MKASLSDEQRRALDQQPEGIEVQDDQTQKVYFLADADQHRRAMQALQQQEDWDAIQQGLKEREQGLEEPLTEVDAEIREEFDFPPRV